MTSEGNYELNKDEKILMIIYVMNTQDTISYYM